MEKEFKILHQDNSSSARVGLLRTSHGDIQTPAFAPVASQGSVKALTHEIVAGLGAQLILVNAYHLFLRPGIKTINNLGGIHSFISWPGPILSDSGGFQIYSLSPLTRISKKGVSFSSHIDGTKIFLTSEKVVDIQLQMGTDILMPLDNFAPYPSPKPTAEESVNLTTEWTERAREHFVKHKLSSSRFLFGICQGGVFRDLREKSIEDLVRFEFDGYSLGGLGLGEPKSLFNEIVEYSTQLLPPDKPRYLMGIGYIADILEAVKKGVDLFDCVLPTRNARTGTLFTNQGKLVIKHKRYTDDHLPIDETCSCYTCSNFSRAYLRHLYERNEITSSILNTIHNLHFYLDIFRKIRQAIELNSFDKFKCNLLEKLTKDKEDDSF
ncbi:MAG: tRNA guanosine(34) transglycosylase Tgt [Acidobacteriota bacterium]